MRRESVSPSPVPSSREVPRPPCWNDSKIRSRSASGTPMPVSVDGDLDVVARLAGAHHHGAAVAR